MTGGPGPELFLTGFPGFLGSDLLVRLLRDRDGGRAHCLVPARHGRLARERLRRGPLPGEPGRRVRLHEGDLTEPGLGLEPSERRDLAGRVDQVFHLAALYDLEVEPERADAVNRRGTERVLDFAARCGGLRCFHHMSTCYVSGDYEGRFREDQLDEGQSFHNAYERSKMRAEAAVRERGEGGMPTAIYRPSIVVGDRDTGFTQKYDGPYRVVRWILRQPRRAVVPLPPGSGRSTLNLVPRDFVTRAVAYLGRRSEVRGETVHLADPDPPTVREAVRRIARAAGRRVLELPVPPAVLRWALESVPGLRRLTGVSPALADYFLHPARYDTRRAGQLLEGSGIRPPRFGAYVDRMVDFVRRNPEPPAGPLT